MAAPKDSQTDSPLRAPRPVVARFSETPKTMKTYAQIYNFCEVRNCQEDRLEHELFCAAHCNVDAF